MRYYVNDSSGVRPTLGAKVLAVLILAACLALFVTLFIIFSYVFLAVAGALILLGLLALLVSGFRRPPKV
jgi:hypothetical protein